MSMRGHAMGGGRGGGWAGMRSMRQDRSVLQHRVKKGTARRMLTFAVPYRRSWPSSSPSSSSTPSSAP